MYLFKEIYRDQYYTTKKETFYNDKKDITAVLEVTGDFSTETGYLGVYDHSGDKVRIVQYKSGSDSYKAFMEKGSKVLGTHNWHTPKEAASIRESQYENGLLVAERYESEEYGVTSSVSYKYEKGQKVLEIRKADDGTVTRTEFVYQGKTLLSKSTVINDQFSEQINYMYGNDQLLEEEQVFGKHGESLYLTFQRKFFYNAKKEVERTDFYGRYNKELRLYKVEEDIRQGNTQTKKTKVVANIEHLLGYYDLATLHNKLKQDQMEWALAIFDTRYFDNNHLMLVSHTVERYDDRNNPVATELYNPENGALLTKVIYRNEYNEQFQLEFTISYRQTDDGTMEESSIKKLYYRN